MHHSNVPPRIRMCALAALVAAFIACSAAIAVAAPPQTTIGTSELQQLIDANGGPVEGYMRTVMKGSTVTTIPVELEAVTSGFADGPPELSALILFRAHGDYIDGPNGVGGIASGMSGSPIFLQDGDVLVGAVSYGDWFTLNGYGLATPIDAMAAIEAGYPSNATGFRSLSQPVLIEGRAVNSVIVAPAPEKLDSDVTDSAFVAKPLSAQYLGGLNPRNKVYEAYRKHLESHGGELVPLAYGLSSMEYPQNWAFEPGAAVAALAARGDLWAGGIGTVTYVNDDNVLAFGHPAYHSGVSGLFMSNAWIDGVWPSTNSPYKLGRPAGLRGTITQDRGAGIMGVDGLMPPVASVEATVFNVDSEAGTSKVGTSTVEIPSFAINSASWDFEGLAPMSAYIAATRACDSYSMKGSALTTTTVVVRDTEVPSEFEIVRTNMFDDAADVPAAAMMDVAQIVSELQQLGDNGIAHPEIVSVDVVATITDARRTAEIIDVTVAGGLKTGNNVAKVSLLQWGVEDTQTVDVPFNIPGGVPITGELQASGPSGPEPDEEFSESMLFEETSVSSVDRRTLAQAVSDIDAALPNNALVITFSPAALASDLGPAPVAPKTYAPIEATRELEYVVAGSAGKSAPKFSLAAWDPTLPYNDMTIIEGELLGAENESKIAVSRQFAGSSTPSALTTITFDPAEGTFEYMTPFLTRTAKFTFSFAGDADTLPTAGSLTVNVRARTTLSASRTTFKKGKTTTLTATVAPTSATGKIVFERSIGGWWYSIGTRNLAGGRASMTYKPGKVGTYKIRARYVSVGGSTNAASTSSTRTLKVTR